VTERRDRSSGRWARWVGFWMRCYPRRFRDEFGADLTRQYLALPGHDRGARRGLSAARDLVAGGLGARWDDLRRARVGGEGRLAGLGGDLALGARMLRRRPAVSAAVVVTLALSAGLAAAVFGIYDATFVRALPYPAHERIVSIGSTWHGFEHSAVSAPEYFDYKERAGTLAHVALIRTLTLNLADGPGGPERADGAQVTVSFFDVMGVPAALGRVIGERDAGLDGPAVAVISHAFWTRRFGRSPGAIGSILRMNDRPVEVIGVMPPRFEVPERRTDAWLPLRLDPASPGGRGAHNRRVLARLDDDADLTAAAAELAGIGRQLAIEHPENYPPGSGWGVSVRTLRDLEVGDLRAPMRLLLVAVLFLLLIAAANVSGLLLARAHERAPELAMRAALGASRGRLARLLVVEGLVAGLAGGALAVLVAQLLLAALGAGLPEALRRPGLVLADWRVVVFALGATALAAGAAAAAAFVTARRGTVEDLQSSDRQSRGRAARRARTALVVVEIALAFVLVAGAGLTIRSFARLLAVDPGLAIEHVHTARVALPSARYDERDDVLRFYDDLLASIEATPGVGSAGAVSVLPLSGSTTDFNFGIEGYVPPAPGLEANAQTRIVTGRYFDAFGVPVVEGRAFDRRDVPDGEQVAIVTEELAREYWPGGEALGRRIKLWSLEDPGPWRTIVGIVADVRHDGLSAPATPMLYLPLSQYLQRTLTLVARGAGADPPARLIEERVRALDASQPIYDVRSMREWLAASVAQPRLTFRLLTVYAVTALLLAALGIYGVMAQVVAGRTKELGIRVALGAGPGRVARLVLGYGAAVTAVGLAIGATGALAGGRYVVATSFGVDAFEPAVFAAAALTLAAAALAACALPVRRVLRIDPVRALRGD